MGKVIFEFTVNLRTEKTVTNTRAKEIIEAHIARVRNSAQPIDLPLDATDQQKLDWFVDHILAAPLQSWRLWKVQEAARVASEPVQEQVKDVGWV
jgi:hypothetical protein